MLVEKIIKIAFNTVLITVLTALICQANPIVNSVNGQLDQGSTVQIYGYGFGSHADNSPGDGTYLLARWCNLESGSCPSSGWNNFGGNAKLSTENNRPNSTYNASHEADKTSESYTDILGNRRNREIRRGLWNDKDMKDASRDYFWSGWYWFSDGIINGDIAQWKIMTGDQLPGNKTYFIIRSGRCPPAPAEDLDHAVLRTTKEDGEQGEDLDCLSEYTYHDGWLRLDIWANPAPNGGFVKWYVNSKLVREDTYEDSAPQAFERLYYNSYQKGDGFPKTWIRTDDHFINFTQARVELCASSTWNWNTQDHCELQLPVSWSDNSITVEVNPGSFSHGKKAYLYVVDRNGKVNTEGFRISIGDVSDGTPPPGPTPKPPTESTPNPPTGLRIITN